MACAAPKLNLLKAARFFSGKFTDSGDEVPEVLESTGFAPHFEPTSEVEFAAPASEWPPERSVNLLIFFVM